MLYQIFRPFAYLSIKNIGHKWFYDYLYPLFLTVITICVILFGNEFDIKKIIEGNKIGSGIFDIIKGMPGFFIAALAAVATFNRDSLDSPISYGIENSPTVKTRIIDQNGIIQFDDKNISRRVFLSMMFAFLSAASFVLAAVYVVYSSSGLMSTDNWIIFSILNVYFIFQFWQILICTFFGLFYLADKMHQ